MGLDTFVYRMVKPEEWMRKKPYSLRYLLRGKYKNAEFTRAANFDKGSYACPEEYLFKVKRPYTSFEKMFKAYFPKKAKMDYNDGWRCIFEGTCPWKEEDRVPGCDWYMAFQHGNDENYVTIPLTKELSKKAEVVEEELGVLHDIGSIGYMRNGANDAFYDAMRAGMPNYLFSREAVEKYRDKFFGGPGSDFDRQICEPFGDGKGKYVWFWY